MPDVEKRHVFVYDDTQGALTATWWFGSLLRSLRPGRDEILKVRSWAEMLEGFQQYPDGSVEWAEFWGHGLSGKVFCNHASLDVGALEGLQRKMTGPEALWWWRTCKTFWGAAGADFAEACVDKLGCKVAGFSHTIWAWQSGLRWVNADKTFGTPSQAGWPADGGKWSWPWRRDTVFCMSSGPF